MGSQREGDPGSATKELAGGQSEPKVNAGVTDQITGRKAELGNYVSGCHGGGDLVPRAEDLL